MTDTYTPTTDIDSAHRITTDLQLLEHFDGEVERAIGDPFLTRINLGARNYTEGKLGSPSIARLRAAVLLLAGITDQDILDVTSRDRDRLTEVLRRIDDGEL